MANQATEPNENQESAVKIGSWEDAFAYLNSKDQKDSEESANADPGERDGQAAQGAGGQQPLSDNLETGNIDGNAANVGGLDPDAGVVAQEDGESSQGLFGGADLDAEQFREKLGADIRDQAIREIAEEFVKRGVRNRNGMLGASLDDEDICKRGKDGVPRFFNPETGREFTGDNPRSQAQKWVDDFNKELARVFNEACSNYESHLMEEAKPKLAVVEFAPKYKALDPIRRGMFDNVIEDYEVNDDDGNVIGYSCDLDKALAMVERQIAMIQKYAKEHAPATPEPVRTPALDMKTSSGAVGQRVGAEPKSLAEAMEMLQNEQLEKIRGGRR